MVPELWTCPAIFLFHLLPFSNDYAWPCLMHPSLSFTHTHTGACARARAPCVLLHISDAYQRSLGLGGIGRGGGGEGVIQIRIRAAQGSFQPGIRGNVPFSLFYFQILSVLYGQWQELSLQGETMLMCPSLPTPRPRPRLRRASEAERKDEACNGS